MKKKFTYAFFVLAVFWGALAAFPDSPGSASSGGIEWKSYKEGVSAAEKDSKKLLITFYADGCTYCKIMDRETFNDAAIVSYINKNFVPVRVDSDKERGTAKDFMVRGVPDTWFVSEDKEVIGHRVGFIPAETMIEVLKYINTDSYKEMSFKSFMKSK